MPLERIEGSKAFNSLRGVARYPTPARDPERYVPVPSVAHTAKFTIGPSDRIFTIGSCFARNIEHALVSLGLKVESSFTSGSGTGVNAGAVSLKYTTKSILRDLMTFDDPEAQKQSIYTDGTGFFNLSLGGSGAEKSLPENETLALTEAYYTNFAKLKTANVLIMTLGLVEAWYDIESNCYLNIAPNRKLIRQYPERFELHVLSYHDIVEDLEKILTRVREIGQPDVKMLVTVSPVPLHATFRGMDVLQANMYSKCVQRAAVEEFCTKNPEVAYFPSFETVMLSAPAVAWVDDDFRHVRPELVKRIMSSVLRLYTDILDEPSSEYLKQLFSRQSYAEIVRSIDAYVQSSDQKLSRTPPYVRYYYACALDELGDKQRSRDILSEVVNVWRDHAPAKRRLEKLAGELTIPAAV